MQGVHEHGHVISDLYINTYICMCGYTIYIKCVLQFCFQPYLAKRCETSYMHIYVAAYLAELSLMSLLIFSIGTQRAKVLMNSDSDWAKAMLNAFSKRGRKYEPESSKQWRKFWPLASLQHNFVWDFSFKDQLFLRVLDLLSAIASQEYRSPKTSSQ